MTNLQGLVTAAQQGDKDAFGQIVTRFQDMAYASAYAMLGDLGLAQDVAQEAFIDAYLNLTKLRDPAAFPGWFRRIVIGNSHRQLRGRPAATVSLDDVGSLYANLHDPVDLLETAQLRQSIHDAIGALPEGQRLATALFYVEGYSHKEIASFLEVPVSTIKKRLFDARHTLKTRMIPMVQQTLQTTKPSQNTDFANQVQFFIALRDQDLSRVKKFVSQHPELLQAKTEWKMALGHHYWPLGSTALHLVAGTGNEEILTYLLTQPVDINEKNLSGLTALHIAVIMRQVQAVQLLLQHGADVNARSSVGQTPLHHAVLRNNTEMVQLLMEYKAAVTITDVEGRTPMDWASIRRNREVIDWLVAHGAARPAKLPAVKTIKTQARPVPLAKQWLGRIINGLGQPLDGAELPTAVAQSPSDLPAPIIKPPCLTTGIKIIDLLAPLPRGGQIGIFTPLAGVGLMVVLGQLIDSMHALHNGHTVWLFMESDRLRAADQKLLWREVGVDDKMVFVAGHQQDTAPQQMQTVATGLRMAEQLRQTGEDVLLLVDSQFARIEGVVPYLRANATVTPAAAITTIYHGHYTVGVEPKPLQDLDATLTFEYTRAKQRLYPAIDPVRSTSRLLQNDGLESAHRQVATEVKRLLQRYSDLRAPMDTHNMGVDALWYIEDDPHLAEEINRARRLDRFLTQPFYGAEPWTGIIGELVSVADTVAGCQAILNGQYDKLPEEAFRFIGVIEQAVEKAKRQ